MDDSSIDDSFLNTGAQQRESTDNDNSFSKVTNSQDKSFNKVSSIDKLNKTPSKSKSRDNISANNVSNLQQEVIQEEAMDQVLDIEEFQGDKPLNEAPAQGDEPEEVAQVIQHGKTEKVKPWKKFTNENDSSDEDDEAAPDSYFNDNQIDSQMPSFVPANVGLYNNRRLMTAPEGTGRRKGGKGFTDRAVIGGAFQQTFVENDLMKAANIYQQFDKKGNLYENRLYAKTSINQAKFNKDQHQYDQRMESHPDEEARINNGSSVVDKNEPEQMSLTQQNKSSVNGTQNASVSINGQLKSSSTVTNGFVKSRIRVSTGMGLSKGKLTALSPRLTEMRETHLTGGTIMGGTFSKSNAPKIARKEGVLSHTSLFEKVEAEANKNNKDMNLTKTQRSLSNTQFSNIKKNLNKLQSLNIQNASWSRRDQDLRYVTGGIGGKQNIFEMAQNLQTNDPMLFREKGYNETSNNFSPGSQNQHMLKTFYQYYDQEGGRTIKVHDKSDKRGAFGVGRYINSQNRNFYSRQLDNKGRSNVAFTQREHAAGYAEQVNKIQKKAYRANTQSRQVDGLYKEAKYTARPSLMNYTRSDFNILRPGQNVKQVTASAGDPKKLMEVMRGGKCHQFYGISDFNQNSRISGVKYHEKYQSSFSHNDRMFRRQNGEFTSYSNNLQHCKF